jgi:chemotaxis protein CheD
MAIFIHAGEIFTDTRSSTVISTVLGSCVAVCLYDTKNKIGGMNHYLLPFWNGNGLQSPQFGNISIPKLIKSMYQKGAEKRFLQAKVFGGASFVSMQSKNMMIGEKNILVAQEILKKYKIAIVAGDVGGERGRKIVFNLESGKVLLQYMEKKQWL